MYRFLFFLLVSFLFVPGAGASEIFRYWFVSGASTLEIQGASNVNTFTCASSVFKGRDVLVEIQKEGGTVLAGEIFLDVKGFDCQNRMMNSDFQNTLRASDYPEIRIEFLDLKETGSKGRDTKAEGWVEITLVGKKKKYPVILEVQSLSKYQNVLTGKQTFRFSDFGIEPPQRALGMVRVKDEITVEFSLKLKLAGNHDNITVTR
jgi:polyisoprenoid-binding protein YceI